MRIKEIFIQRYGKLRPFHAKFEKNAYVIFGPGGSGKTLIIDAILKMLLGDSALSFVRHKEVDEAPAGYIVIEKEGKEYKLGGEKHLSDLPGLELDPVELKNIFIIEDADLEIGEEDEFYGRVTNKLIGVRTEDIHRIRDELRRRGRLTPSLGIIATRPHKVGEKLENAKEHRDKVKEYLEEAKSKGIDKLEKEKFDLGWDLKKLEVSIDLLEQARKKSEYDKLEVAFSGSVENQQALKKLPNKDNISQLKAKFLNSKKEEERLWQLGQERKSWKERFQYLTISTVIAFVVLAVFKVEPFSTILPIILLFVSLFSLYEWHKSDQSIAKLETMKQSLVREARALGIEAENVEGVGTEINTISNRIEEEEATFNQKKGILGKDLQIDESDPEKFMEKAREALAKLRSNVDLDVAVTYDKDKLEKARAEQKIINQRLSEVDKQLRAHQDAMQIFSEKALRLQFADEFSNFKLDFDVRNLDSLEKLVEWINRYIEQLEMDAEYSREAFRIFEELELKEKAKSEELFGKNSQASKIFRNITSGMFEEVNYDSSKREIMVKRSHEKGLQKESELSRSEWAQLYMAIRVALGESLLKGEEGFFIVEEPFIHADPERLIKEFDVLKNLSKRGWQTLYFTAKDEIKKGLPKKMDAVIIEMERLP